MRFFITCDCYWEAKIDKVIDVMDNSGYKHYFSEQNYGTSLEGITVVLMCQNPDLNLKQRIRYSKKERKIYLDIMLDLKQILSLNQKEKEVIVVIKIISEIPPIIGKYKLEDFDISRFTSDLKKSFQRIV